MSYQSIYTGAQIDEAIGEARKALISGGISERVSMPSTDAVISEAAVDRFVRAMNYRAGELGMIRTNFFSPAGSLNPSADQLAGSLKFGDSSTASDLLRLIVAAYYTERTRNVMSTKTRSVYVNGEHRTVNHSIINNPDSDTFFAQYGFSMVGGKGGSLRITAQRLAQYQYGLRNICMIMKDASYYYAIVLIGLHNYEDYSTSKSYVPGDLVHKNWAGWECTSATSGTWDPSCWSQMPYVDVWREPAAEMLRILNGDYNEVDPNDTPYLYNLTHDATYNKGYYPGFAGIKLSGNWMTDAAAVEAGTGFYLNDDDPKVTASCAKIMTSILCAEHSYEGELELHERDLVGGSSASFIKAAGDRMSALDAMYVSMLISDNAWTHALGQAVGRQMVLDTIGGSNLLIGASTFAGWSPYSDSDRVAEKISGGRSEPIAHFGAADTLGSITRLTAAGIQMEDVLGKQVTLSWEMKVPNADAANAESGGIEIELQTRDTQSGTMTRYYQYHTNDAYGVDPRFRFSEKWKKYSFSFVVTPGLFDLTYAAGDVDETKWFGIRINCNIPEEFYIRNVQLEYGGQATDWQIPNSDILTALASIEARLTALGG